MKSWIKCVEVEISSLQLLQMEGPLLDGLDFMPFLGAIYLSIRLLKQKKNINQIQM